MPLNCKSLACVWLAATICALGRACTLQKHEDGMHVDCSHQHLTSLLITWPDDVVWLDLSYNQLSVLTDLYHPHLARLQHLDLSNNQLNATLSNNTFWPFHQLQWLSLQFNNLQGLEVKAFAGLEQLTFLDMSNNQISHDAYPLEVFEPLTSLHELLIHYNDDNWRGKYPDTAFRPLINLQILSVDTFFTAGSDLPEGDNPNEPQFGPGFGELRNLRELWLNTGYSNLKHLSNFTLAPFRNSSLEEIRVGSHRLMEVDACAFCGFTHLKRLYVNEVSIPLTGLLRSLYGLQYQNITLLDLSATDFVHGVELKEEDTRYLRNICVTKLNLASTNIQWITRNALFETGSLIVRCLEDLDVSNNRLLGDIRTLLFLLSAFRRLKSFRLDRQRVYDLSHADCLLRQNEKRQSCWGVDEAFSADIKYNIPPSLVYVNLSSYGGRVGALPSVIEIPTGSELKILDMSSIGMSNCYTTLVGATNLESLVFSNNYCYNVSETIFDGLPSLRHLWLSNFNIEPEFFRARAWRLFRDLHLLQTLDLSYNNLHLVDPHMLRAQRNLKELNLAGNRFQSVPVDLGPHEDLQLLDLSNNMLTSLLPQERHALDTLVSRHNFDVRLRGNPLLCACSNLDFVGWLWTTSVQLDGDGNSARNYTCVTDTGEMSDTITVMMQYDVHWRRCVGSSILSGVLVAFWLQILSLVMVYVMSRNWTHICYAWKMMKRLRLPRREDFVWDVYVGYADADWKLACVTLPARLEEDHGLKLLLRDRDELVGSVRAESIVDHIDSSWKVLLLVTRAFATDEWLCGFTVQQAQRSITDTMPDRVIVVLLEDPGRLPPMASLERLLRMVPERNVVHVYRDGRPGRALWERIARDILGENEPHP